MTHIWVVRRQTVKILILLNYDTYNKTLLAPLDFPMLLILANESVVTESFFFGGGGNFVT